MTCSARRRIPVMARTDRSSKTSPRCTARCTKRCSSNWLTKRPARPAITTDLVKLPARLPAPHIDEKKGGSGSRAVSLGILGSGRAGGQEGHWKMSGLGGQTGVWTVRRVQKEERQRKGLAGRERALVDGWNGDLSSGDKWAVEQDGVEIR
jgi:hypothetical protein